MGSSSSASPAAFVTGAANGIGEAVVARFLRGGYRVAMVDLDADRLHAARKKADPTGERVIEVVADVRDEQSVRAAVAATVEEFGRLDAAHNNAGVTSSGPNTHELDLKAWQHTLDVDLTGVWLCMKYQLPVLLQQGTGAIINTASIAGHIGYRNAAAYAAAKHGVVGLTKTAAIEYAPHGIRVNAVSPGPVQSDMLDASFARRGAAVRDWYYASSPTGRFASLDDVAHAVHWLASEEASFITGHCLSVDGGWIAQ
ncbi:SDR family NAD(P)-dependent oxidoreductase [Amycolatopsis sp. QT-25]|uniref:SDR family NAD(P)-dependent oxidoreductase n=1 Tax=Amycolatopsis sp. QT-25 TaxID=3034022 RepID=UPI0023EE0E36|nr:SDR family NAD(P)-dependent oxidoreductase [Amycolatopsis sp. QT-25]WET76549.1 SDR family NAD(P)-dependent oxidoreductase [Amycolatopsis sp. QT-25]